MRVENMSKDSHIDLTSATTCEDQSVNSAVLLVGSPWFALAFPVVHALPGLIGHRLFERNAAVGDIRVTRKDHPPLWFIAGNHLMTVELLLKGFYWRDLRGGATKQPSSR